MTPPSHTGPQRRRPTRPGVRVAEVFARLLISVGGIGTILAVTLILFFLAWVVAPLFQGAHAESTVSAPTRGAEHSGPILHAAVDEQGLLGWSLDPDGSPTLWRADTGALIERGKPFVPGSLTATSFPIQSGAAVLGFADGSLRMAHFAFRSQVHDPAQRSDLEQQLGPEPVAHFEGAVLQRTPDGQIRTIEMETEVDDPIDASLVGPVLLLDASGDDSRRTVVAMGGDGNLVVEQVARTENFLTGESTWENSRSALPPLYDLSDRPHWLLLSGGGDLLYLVWRDGRLLRCDLRDPEQARAVEEVDLVEGEGQLTAITFLIGKNTLVAGDSRGQVQAWFPIKPAGASSADGIELALAHRLCESGPAITAFASSARSRVVAAGDADGGVRLWHVTSRKELAALSAPEEAEREPVLALALSPRDDGITALTAKHIMGWSLELRHPEASLGALFAPVWYEGYSSPEHVWQSAGGTDDFEPKLGLIPLVFGTLKATVYSMLFAVPLALLGAIFTSQFLSPGLRTPIKSAVEMMASLPSVVLGFLAAILIAPFAQAVVPAILASLFTVPFALLFGARLWQLLPAAIAQRLSGVPRLLAMFVAVFTGIAGAALFGPVLERLLFAGDLRAWLDHRRGSAMGGWVILLLPAAAIAVGLVLSRTVDQRIRRLSVGWDRSRCARFDLLRFLVGSALAIALAFGAAWVLQGLWLDPRGGIFDTYVQRNALIVGFVMGFAVVPIVYTLADDALSSVPEHLRLASLGAGATPWQTAIRIIVPTAASGLFSAVMVGLGRAVGETMIVLMATGNTPILSWNVFDGFRTLSANIAVELPEAVKNHTHYRTLFLAALCLFALTFSLNTLAEIVRQRFRRRAFQL